MTPTKYHFYEEIAKYRKASLLTSQCRAIIHLENKNDQIKKLYTRKESFTNKITKDALWSTYPEINKCIRDIQFIWEA